MPSSGALAKAAHRLTRSYTVAYIAHVPLEPRAALAQWSRDAGGEREAGRAQEVAPPDGDGGEERWVEEQSDCPARAGKGRCSQAVRARHRNGHGRRGHEVGEPVVQHRECHSGVPEGELRERPWFAGSEFSAADIQMSFPLEAAAARGGLDASRPKLMGFLDRIHARPAYRRALEAGGPYELLR